MYYISKRIEISAAHRLDLPYASKCANLHGHNWIVTVHCAAPALNEAGIVATFGIAPGPAALPELLTGTKRNVEATCAAIASLLSVARECSSRPHQ